MTLESWNEGPTRAEILDFVTRVTAEGGPDYVTPSERIAVFDNDGTLWCEQPAYLQAFFVLQRLHEQATADPDLANRDVVKALLDNDLAAAGKGGIEPVVEVLLQTYAGITTEEFESAVTSWLADFRHPRFGTSFERLVYAPMLELLELLRSNEFRVFIVTGGGVDFIRPVSVQLYGVDPDDVVGSAVEVDMERRDGKVVLMRKATLAGSPNEGSPKVTNIHAHIGRRPIVAVGNTAGDREMLEFAHTGEQPSLCLVVNHDDDEREYAYGGGALTNPNAEPILTTAKQFGWTVASMRNDWSRVFA
jgi:phosphoglycolate phosphatase-like HAD superfamily hydrolase